MARQSELPGYEGKKIRELDDAAAVGHKLGKQATRIRLKQGESNDSLLKLMQKHGIEIYTDRTHAPPITIRVSQGKTKVKLETDDDENDDGGDEAEVIVK